MTNLTIIIIIIFILGLYFTLTQSSKSVLEAFQGNQCPNVLIQKGKKLYLKNENLAEIPGVNPIVFDNLEEYVEYLKWQRKNKVNCPVLFLQESYDTQGNQVYQIRPDPLNLEGGLNSQLPLGTNPADSTKLIDAGRNDPPYNKNSFPAYDPMNLYQGEFTPLDKMYHEPKNKKSGNAMDPNWGGISYTNELVNSGYYEPNK
tara:strand:- start:7244 stop:7849 length:606 start_codon:yes stop_codon:yes gene_type:complete